MSSDGDPAREEQISALVARLSRPHHSGGRVIEHAAVLAEGANAAAILNWIAASGWTPEHAVADTADRGGSGVQSMRRDAEPSRSRAPRRYISSPGAGG